MCSHKADLDSLFADRGTLCRCGVLLPRSALAAAEWRALCHHPQLLIGVLPTAAHRHTECGLYPFTVMFDSAAGMDLCMDRQSGRQLRAYFVLLCTHLDCLPDYRGFCSDFLAGRSDRCTFSFGHNQPCAGAKSCRGQCFGLVAFSSYSHFVFCFDIPLAACRLCA